MKAVQQFPRCLLESGDEKPLVSTFAPSLRLVCVAGGCAPLWEGLSCADWIYVCPSQHQMGASPAQHDSLLTCNALPAKPIHLCQRFECVQGMSRSPCSMSLEFRVRLFFGEGCSPRSCCLSNALLLSSTRVSLLHASLWLLPSMFSTATAMWTLTHLHMSTEDDRQTRWRPFNLPAVKRQGRAPGGTPTLSQLGK